MTKLITVEVPSTATGFQTFTPYEYVLIELSNHLGCDKMTFESRIATAKANLHQLEDLVDEADEPVLFLKAVLNFRKIQQGIPSSAVFHFDATASGTQIQAALFGCVKTATAVNMVNPNVREDLYTNIAEPMSAMVGQIIRRSLIKNPIMTFGYGSDAEPEKVFGKGTKELNAFYKAIQDTIPAAMYTRQLLADAWKNGALYHEWNMPNGSVAHIKVIAPVHHKVEVEGLGSFTHIVKHNIGLRKGEKGTKSIIVKVLTKTAVM